MEIYNGQLKGFPNEVVDLMLHYQVMHGNKRDVTVFEKEIECDVKYGGFDWDETPEGSYFWVKVIRGDFNVFFERYPKQIKEDPRKYNVGKSDYAKRKIQPWDIWLEYNLNPWDADIIKRVLRNKEGEDRKTEYEKIIHICKERIRQLNQEKDE